MIINLAVVTLSFVRVISCQGYIWKTVKLKKIIDVQFDLSVNRSDLEFENLVWAISQNYKV